MKELNREVSARELYRCEELMSDFSEMLVLDFEILTGAEFKNCPPRFIKKSSKVQGILTAISVVKGKSEIRLELPQDCAFYHHYRYNFYYTMASYNLSVEAPSFVDCKLVPAKSLIALHEKAVRICKNQTPLKGGE